jgi:hypothetical protein
MVHWSMWPILANVFYHRLGKGGVFINKVPFKLTYGLHYGQVLFLGLLLVKKYN